MRQQIEPKLSELNFMYMELREEIELFNKLIKAFEEIYFTRDDVPLNTPRTNNKEKMKGKRISSIPRKLGAQVAFINKTEWYFQFHRQLTVLHQRLSDEPKDNTEPLSKILSKKGLLPFLNNTSHAIRFKIEIILPTLSQLLERIESYLKKCLKKKKNTAQKRILLNEIQQVQQIKKAVKINKELLIENMLIRLNLAANMLDMSYDDISLSLETEILKQNNKYASFFTEFTLPPRPTIAQHGLNKTNFYSFHHFINTYTTQEWHPNAQREYQKLIEQYNHIGRQGPIVFTTHFFRGLPTAIPVTLQQEIPKYRLWPKWLFAGHNLRHRFFKNQFYDLMTINCHYQLIQKNLIKMTIEFQDCYFEFKQATSLLAQQLELAKKSMSNGWFKRHFKSHSNAFLQNWIEICSACQHKFIKQKLNYLKKSFSYFQNNSKPLLDYLLSGSIHKNMLYLTHLQCLLIDVENEFVTNKLEKNRQDLINLKKNYTDHVLMLIKKLLKELLARDKIFSKAYLEDLTLRLKILALLSDERKTALQNMIQVMKLDNPNLSQINLIHELEILFSEDFSQKTQFANQIIEKYLLPSLTDCHTIAAEFVNRHNPSLNWLILQTQASAKLIVRLFENNSENILPVTNQPFSICWETWKAEKDGLNEDHLLTLERAIGHVEFLFSSRDETAISNVTTSIKKYLDHYQGNNLIYAPLISATQDPQIISIYGLKIFNNLLQKKSYKKMINHIFINQHANDDPPYLLNGMQDLLTHHIHNREFDYTNHHLTSLIKLLHHGSRLDLIIIVLNDFLEKYQVKSQYDEEFLQDLIQCHTFLSHFLAQKSDREFNEKEKLFNQFNKLESIIAIEKKFHLFEELIINKNIDACLELIKNLIREYHDHSSENLIFRTAQLSLIKINSIIKTIFIETIFNFCSTTSKAISLESIKNLVDRIDSEHIPTELEIHKLKFLSEYNYSIHYDLFDLNQQLRKLLKLNPFEQVLHFNIIIDKNLLMALSLLPINHATTLEENLSELVHTKASSHNPWIEIFTIILKAVIGETLSTTDTNLIELSSKFKNYIYLLTIFNHYDDGQINKLREIETDLLNSQFGNQQYKDYWHHWIVFLKNLNCQYDFSRFKTHFNIREAELTGTDAKHECDQRTFKCPPYLRIARILEQHNKNKIITRKQFKFIYRHYYQNKKLLINQQDLKNREKIIQLINTAIQLLPEVNCEYMENKIISDQQFINYCNIIRFLTPTKYVKRLDIIIEKFLLNLFQQFISGKIDIHASKLEIITENIANSQQVNFLIYIQKIRDFNGELDMIYPCNVKWLGLCCKVLFNIVVSIMKTAKLETNKMVRELIKKLKIINYNDHHPHKITSEYIPQVIKHLQQLITLSLIAEISAQFTRIQKFFENIELNASELHFMGYLHSSNLHRLPPVYILTESSSQYNPGVTYAQNS